MKTLDEALRRADANALEAYRGMPAGSRDVDTVQRVTQAALASLAHQGWLLQQGWQPIETAPADGSVIVCTVEGHVGEARSFAEDGWYWMSNDPSDAWGGPISPRWWMPLPAAPKGGEG